MANRLRVSLNQKHVGEIILDGMDDRYALEYASSWLSEGLVDPLVKTIILWV
jgi:hypothetical protein